MCAYIYICRAEVTLFAEVTTSTDDIVEVITSTIILAEVITSSLHFVEVTVNDIINFECREFEKKYSFSLCFLLLCSCVD
jgi:hypothetical protein